MPTPADYSSAVDAVLANADYAEVGSRAKAKALHTALTKLIVLTPAMAAIGRDGGQEMRYEVGELRQMRQEVSAWLGANPDVAGAASVTFGDLSRLRD